MTNADTEAGRGEGRRGEPDAYIVRAWHPESGWQEHISSPNEVDRWMRHFRKSPVCEDFPSEKVEKVPLYRAPDARQGERGEVDRLFDHLNVYTTPSGPADERWVEGRVPGDLLARLRAPPDEAPEGTVYATISCENPECESRGQEPHKLHDGDPMDYCQVCCEETLTLRLHTPPPVEEGERGEDLDWTRDLCSFLNGQIPIYVQAGQLKEAKRLRESVEKLADLRRLRSTPQGEDGDAEN